MVLHALWADGILGFAGRGRVVFLGRCDLTRDTFGGRERVQLADL
jgi:hypothetical protein